MPTIHALEIFVTLYQTLSVTKTAKIHYSSEPSISRSIKNLENEYNTLLFERYQHSFIPTEKANILYEQALLLLDNYKNMNASMLSQNTTIRIGSTLTISNTLLPSLIKSSPENLRIEVTVSNGLSLQQDLLSNKLDLALIENKVNSDTLISTPFANDHLILVVSNNHPLTKQKEVTLLDLQNYPFLQREKGSAVREYLDELFVQENIHIDALWQSRSTQALLYAVEENIGITILPEKMCQKEIKSHQLSALRIKDFPLERKYYVVYHKDKKFNSTLSAFKSLILNS